MLVHIDFETRSRADLSEIGVYRYAEDESTEVLSVAWAVEDGPVQVRRILGRPWPSELLDIASDPSVTFVAHNAAFERAIWAAQLDLPPVPIERWSCTMALCLYRGLPAKLDLAAHVLGLGIGKLAYGKALLRLVTRPGRASTLKLDNGERLAPAYDKRGFAVLDDRLWELLLAYNAQDVEVERQLHAILGNLPAPERATWEHQHRLQWHWSADRNLPAPERATWELDQRINDRGIAVDLELADAMRRMRERGIAAATQAWAAITGLDNATPAKLQGWLASRGVNVDSVAGPVLDQVAQHGGEIADAVTAYRLIKSTSLAKLDRLVECVNRDGRIRGLFRYHGASTGRWAGQLVQPQNLPRPSRDYDVEELARAIKSGSSLDVDPLTAVKDGLRCLFVAGPGKVLCSVDFSSIEARVLAWLAGEQWKVELFERGGDPYIATAERIYPHLKGKIDKKSPERFKGKVAELALGYRGWVSAYRKMAGLNAPPDEEIEQICRAWRDAHPRIVALWYGLEQAAFDAVADRRPVSYAGIEYRLAQHRGRTWLLCTLPNGKRLHYYAPEIALSERSAWNGEKRWTVVYYGYKQTWQRLELAGGLPTENVVQAISREILVEAMHKAEAAGYKIVMHVHDEITAEADIDSPLADHRVLESIMREPAPWRVGLPIGVEGWTGNRYRK